MLLKYSFLMAAVKSGIVLLCLHASCNELIVAIGVPIMLWSRGISQIYTYSEDNALPYILLVGGIYPIYIRVNINFMQ